MKIENIDDVKELTVLDIPIKKRKKAVAKAMHALLRLDQYEEPELPVDAYIESRSGKYIRMLEHSADIAAEMGLYDLSTTVLFGLLKMTKVGRQKADLTIGGVPKLRAEADVSELSDEQIAALLGRKDAE